MAFGKARSEERRPSPTSPSPTDLITKEMDGKTYLFCWLTPEEMRRRAAELDIVKASPGQGVPTLALLEGHKQQRVQDSHSESAPAATLVVQPAPPAGSSCGRGGSSGSRSSLWERRQCQAKAPKLGGMRLDCSKENKEPNGGSLSMQEVLDRYDVMEKLGSGSVTTVYRATRRADRREVALKLMRSMDREMWSFMTSEYHVLAGIKHPSIIGMLDMFDTSQGPVLVMECFGAWSLGKAVPCQGLSEAVARGLFLLLAQAVNHLHQRHLLHRDIHPDNVMVSQDLKDLRLIDFNTACKDGSLTPTGLKLYSSPEILLEKATHSRASDVWSAGLCLHYALRCRLPDEVERLFKAGIFADIAGIESFADVPWPGISVECADALQRCLSALPAARPSAEELLAGDLLRDVLAEDLAQEGS